MSWKGWHFVGYTKRKCASEQEEFVQRNILFILGRSFKSKVAKEGRVHRTIELVVICTGQSRVDQDMYVLYNT
jgi:hypothetical protein